jgi:hypothetical protein
MAQKSVAWMKHRDFFTKTGFLENNIFFCTKRHHKGPICLKNNINLFVDDTFENIDLMKNHGTVSRTYWFVEQAQNQSVPAYSIVCSTWDEIVADITKLIQSNL